MSKDSRRQILLEMNRLWTEQRKGIMLKLHHSDELSTEQIRLVNAQSKLYEDLIGVLRQRRELEDKS